MYRAILRGITFNLSFKVFSYFLSYLISLFIISNYGTQEFGFYTLIITLITITSVLLSFGIPKLIIRDVSRYFHTDERQKVNNLYIRVNNYYLSIFLLLIVIFFFGFLFGFSLYHTFFVSIACGFLFCLTQTNSAKIQASNSVTLGLFFEPVLRQIVFLVCLIFSFYVLKSKSNDTIPLLVYSSFIILFLISHFIQQYFKADLNQKFSPKLFDFSILENAKFIGLSNILFILLSSIEIILISFFATLDDVSYLKIYIFLCSPISLLLGVYSQYMHRNFSVYSQEENYEKIKIINRKFVRIISIISIIYLVFFYVFGQPLVTLLYNGQILLDKKIILILLLANIINVFSGPNLTLCHMMDISGFVTKTLIVIVIGSMILGSILIYSLGILGAALNLLIISFIFNVSLNIKIYKTFKIKSFVH